MKRILKELLPLLLVVVVASVYYLYTPRSAADLHRRIGSSNPNIFDEERIKLSQDFNEYLAAGLPQDPGKTPTIFNHFLGNQRKLQNLRINQAVAEIEKTAVGPGKVRVWSTTNMGAVVKTSSKIIGFDIADQPLSAVQKEIAELADVLLVTHSDNDHYDPALLKKALDLGKTVILPEGLGFLYEEKDSYKIYKLKDGEEINIDGVKITAFQTDHRGDGNFIEPNAWYLVEVGGLKLLHTGDGRDFKDPQKKKGLADSGIDIFLSNRQIHPYNIRDINPKVLVPLHLHKYIHGREQLGESTFEWVLDFYRPYEKDLEGIEVKLLFTGESFEHQYQD